MTVPLITPEGIIEYFLTSDRQYRFARWGRPIVPVVFGVEDQTLEVLKGAVEATVTLAGHKMAETDPELGANLMVFFCRDWSELPAVPNLERMVPGLTDLVARLDAANATRYRTFRTDEEGAIKAAFVFIRVTDEVAEIPADALSLSEAVQTILIWGDGAFESTSPLVLADGVAVLRPEIATLIRAAYDPTLPNVANDTAHALRIYARVVTSNAS